MFPVEVHLIHQGVQLVYRFANGRGASVVRHNGSYGHEEGKWELAVIKWRTANTLEQDWDIDYDTPITSDVLGRLSPYEVDEVLQEIQALP